MMYYHGSLVEGLTKLQPKLPVGAHAQKPLVYLTTSRQLALHYIWDTERLGVKMPMLDIRKDGTFVFQEMFSGALEYFYKGISGYIYHCEGDYPITTDSGVPTCAVSDMAVPVTECEYIADVYGEILQYMKAGKLIYEHYEDLPQWRIDIIRGHITRLIKRNNLLHDCTHPSCHFIQSKFSQYWAEAKVLDEQGLF